MRLLLTGFEPFGKVTVNPSQQIVAHFAGHSESLPQGVVTAVLPVDYQRTGEVLAALLDKHQPDSVLMLGVAQSRSAICPERFALNIKDASLPDNAGYQAQGEAIVPDGPAAYRSTLPLKDLYSAIHKTGTAVKMSNHAGAYLCNYAFYTARHLLTMQQRGNIPCGFIHIPAAGDEPPAMPLPAMIAAIAACIDVLHATVKAHP